MTILLTEEQERLIVLYLKYKGYPISEIAKILDLPKLIVYDRLKRLTKELNELEQLIRS